MISYEEKCRQDARLAILAELARQRDATLSSRSLAMVVDQIVPRRPPEWVETQIVWLEGMGAVNVNRSDLPGIGNVLIATLTKTGRLHVERRSFLAGVTVPADED